MPRPMAVRHYVDLVEQTRSWQSHVCGSLLITAMPWLPGRLTGHAGERDPGLWPGPTV